jgi:hypothetical protein
VLWVEGTQDLVAMATALAENDQAQVQRWLEADVLGKLDDATAADLAERQPSLWAVVVAPWVLVQERAGA